MGALTSRQNADQEEAEFNANHAYRFPPKAGNYFGTHFIMGGERFDTPQPESYLFGENADLNFLGTKPTLFPYPPPQSNEPTKTLNSLVNIRKESIRFVKSKENKYSIEFIFDADAKSSITIHYLCSEDLSPGGMIYASREATLTSETYHFKKGINQLFSQPNHTFNPAAYSDEELSFNDKEIPIAIHCVVEDTLGAEELRQSHTTICVVDKHADGSYALRALKQKIFVDGLCYLLQEIYGIENKNLNKPDDENDDTGSECVICMCDIRDTLILPCRHLSLCYSCADSLRYQANNCPICRAPFKALLQVRAVQKSSTSIVHPITMQDSEGVPNGYQLVSLIEALNGPPNAPQMTLNTQPPTNNARIQGSVPDVSVTEQPATAKTTAVAEDEVPNAVKAAQSLNGVAEKNNKNSPHDGDKEFRLTVISSESSSDSSKTSSLNRKNSNSNKSQTGNSICKSMSRDSIKMVNEKMNNSSNHGESNNKVAAAGKTTTTEEDEDSDTEKLSPLLTQSKSQQLTMAMGENVALKGVVENIDDGSDPEGDHEFKGLKADDSAKDADAKKSLSTPVASLKEKATSLPDSPISGNSTSTRSSGESYSSSSSTRQLLGSTANIETMASIMDEAETTTLGKK